MKWKINIQKFVYRKIDKKLNFNKIDQEKEKSQITIIKNKKKRHIYSPIDIKKRRENYEKKVIIQKGWINLLGRDLAKVTKEEIKYLNGLSIKEVESLL